jgi:hypothetical protein
MILVECNNVQLLWLPGRKGTEGNEIVDQQAKRSTLHPFIGPEPTYGVPKRIAGWVIRLDVKRAPRILAVYYRTKVCKKFHSKLSAERTFKFLKLK